jgi:hypothetical protein
MAAAAGCRSRNEWSVCRKGKWRPALRVACRAAGCTLGVESGDQATAGCAVR